MPTATSTNEGLLILVLLQADVGAGGKAQFDLLSAIRKVRPDLKAAANEA